MKAVVECARPLVSVGIPLYRSRRFLDVIIENIDAIDYQNLEIIISDQHLADDTIALLKERYGADPRFQFLTGTEGINWVENFNLLLRKASGKYFLWMAHDDSYPPDYIRQLVTVLEQNPESVLAFGRVEQVSMDGFLPVFRFLPPPVSADEAWSLASSLKVLTLWHLWIPFRGLIRRSVVEQSDLYIRQTYRNIRADIYWLFAISLRGSLRYVPSCHCTKRFHRQSGGADWRFGPRQSLNACRVLRSYLNDFARSRREAMLAQSVVIPWCLVQGFLPQTATRRLGILTRQVLAGRSS